jgi:hypothetical protein
MLDDELGLTTPFDKMLTTQQKPNAQSFGWDFAQHSAAR